jgi:Fur family ferric uptake transcriptional regulator
MQIHAQEKEQFKKLFEQEGIDRLENRLQVLDVFLTTEQHLTVSELHGMLCNQGYEFSSEFVRDTLKLMCDFGFAQKNRFNNGEIRYEHRHLSQHHDHMVCTKCQEIFEFTNDRLEQLQVEIAASHGFHMLQHQMVIYGICRDCIRQRQHIIPLTAAREGELLRIYAFSGGSGAKLRLRTMGLRLEDLLEVVSNQAAGQVVVSVDCKRYVLGSGLARKIMVVPADENSDTRDASCRKPRPAANNVK